MFSNPSALAISATEQRAAVLTIVSQELVNIPEKKLSAKCTDNWDLLPFLLAFVAAKLMCADFATCEAAISIFYFLAGKMFGG